MAYTITSSPVHSFRRQTHCCRASSSCRPEPCPPCPRAVVPARPWITIRDQGPGLSSFLTVQLPDAMAGEAGRASLVYMDDKKAGSPSDLQQFLVVSYSADSTRYPRWAQAPITGQHRWLAARTQQHLYTHGSPCT